jgi:2-polyprenyl-6-methoxyphenol hydroxylase-like FAD-dependent oxidoreductase
MAHPVLVVGAGPVGLTLALALHQQGIAVRVVDRAPQPSDLSKAVVIWPRTLELLDLHGCVEPFLKAGIEGHGARIQAERHVLVELPFSKVQSPFPYALMIPQNRTEMVLTQLLAERGVQVERQLELTDFSESEGGVSAQLSRADGSQETMPCSYLLGCDGAHSVVRHHLGLAYSGETLESNWVLADVKLDGPAAPDQVAVVWNPDGILALFPIDVDRFRIIGDVSGAEAADPTLEQVQSLVEQRLGPGYRAHDPIWLSHFRINERKVDRYSVGRVFLAGDAAHIHSPAGGQGMNTGMQDAFNLAWKLALVLQNKAGTPLLDTYSQERSAIGDQVLRNAGVLTRVALVRQPLLRRLRNLLFSKLGRSRRLQRRLVQQLCETDLHYRGSALSPVLAASGQGLQPGDRTPDLPCQAAEGETRLHALLGVGRFVLLSVGNPLPPLEPSLAGDWLVAASAVPQAGYVAGRTYLIRPDAYLSSCVSSAEREKLLALWDQWR